MMKPLYKAFIAVGVLAALLVALFLSSRSQEPEQPPPVDETTEDYLLTADLTVVSVTLNNEHGELTFEKNGGEWTVLNHEYARLNTDEVNTLVFSLKGLTSSEIIGNTSDYSPADFGFDAPLSTVDIGYEGGQHDVLLIGMKNPSTNAWYAMRDGSDTIVMINGYTAARYIKSYDDFRDKSLPAVNLESIVKLEIKTAEEDVSLTVPKESEFGSVYALTSMKMERPYEGREVYSTKLEGIYNSVGKMGIEAFVEDNAQNLADYGLEPPSLELNIKDTDGGELCLLFGDDAPDGGIYFMLAGEPHVYSLTKTVAEPVLNATAFGLIDRFIMLYNIVNVSSVDITDGDMVWRMEISRTQGEEKYFINGFEEKPDVFKDIYKSIIGIMADAAISGYEPASDAVATVTFNFNNGNPPSTIRLFAYDDYFYAAELDGVIEFLTSRQYFEALRKALATVS